MCDLQYEHKQTNEIEKTESAILSSIIFYYSSVVNLFEIETISIDWFKNLHAQLIFKTLLTIEPGKEQYDLILISNSLKETCKDKITLKNTLNYLENLNPEIQFYNIQKHVEILNKKHIKLNLNKLSEKILNTSLSTKNFYDFTENWEQEFLNILSNNKTLNFLNAEKILENYEILTKNHQKQSNFLRTLFSSLDYKIKGFTPGELYVLASRPGIGKTTFALNLIANNLENIQISNEHNNAIGIFSLEMTGTSIMEKIIAIHSKIAIKEIKIFQSGKQIEGYKQQLIKETKSLIKNSNLFFCDEINITLEKIIGTIKNWKRKYNLQLVIIDYLQLINLSTDNDSSNISPWQKIGIITRRLKTLTLDLNICILSLSQLNRKFEDRKSEDKTPSLSDLRESGSIEQDADIVMFLYDQNQKENDGTNWLNPIISLKIGKNRNGELGILNFEFEKSQGIFALSDSTEVFE